MTQRTLKTIALQLCVSAVLAANGFSQALAPATPVPTPLVGPYKVIDLSRRNATALDIQNILNSESKNGFKLKTIVGGFLILEK